MRKFNPKNLRYARLLKRYRARYALTQQELAVILEVNERTIRSWERAESRIPRYLLVFFRTMTPK